MDNLEWCIAQYNLNYGTARQRQAETMRGLGGKRVKQMDLDGNTIKEFASAKEAAQQLGIHKSLMWRACSGVRKWRQNIIGEFRFGWMEG
jgi:hypothetical protein